MTRAPADSSDVGARQGPFGVLAPRLKTAAPASEPPRERRPQLAVNSVKPEPATPEVGSSPPDPEPPAPMVRAPEMPEMPPAGREPPDEPPTEKEGTPKGPIESETVPKEAARAPAAPVSKPQNDVSDPSVLRKADQFLEALRQADAHGGIVRVAADADWELPPLIIKPGVRWIVRSEPGKARPRFRFRPGAVAPREPAAWTVLFEVQANALQSGSLQLEGIDLVLPQSEAPRQGSWAAFGVWGGTDLSLTNCTVTVEGDRVGSAAIVVEAADVEGNAPGAAPPAATVRLTDSLLRSGGELIEVSPGRTLDLDLSNSIVATQGSLVHAHGQSRGRDPEPLKLEIALRQVTARAVGGLVQLKSAPGGPELPVAEVSARDSVLATTPEGDPLFRVDGQDALATLRDRINWEGHRVAYHQINTYRRDQTTQIGAVPKSYDRTSWTVAAGTKEADAVHGDLRFVREWAPDRPVWSLQRDDVRLAPDSPARSAGADLQRIPSAPATLEP